MKLVQTLSLLFLLALPGLALCGKPVSVSILSLLQPIQIQITLLSPNGVLCDNPETCPRLIKQNETLHFNLIQSGLREMTSNTSAATYKITCSGECLFKVVVPNKIERIYQGELTLETHEGQINVLLHLDEDELLGGILASEMDSTAPIESLKAFAVAARTFLKAGRRHPSVNADFCDTTHCQVFRAMRPTANMKRALELTERLILTYQKQPFHVYYSRECGGRTATYSEIWNQPSPDYPYYQVDCPSCTISAKEWSVQLSPKHLEMITGISKANLVEQSSVIQITNGASTKRLTFESFRVFAGRGLGWDAIRSNHFAVRIENGQYVFSGKGKGHRVGLCQRGAAGLALHGKDYISILAHYFPNTEIRTADSL